MSHDKKYNGVQPNLLKFQYHCCVVSLWCFSVYSSWEWVCWSLLPVEKYWSSRLIGCWLLSEFYITFLRFIVDFLCPWFNVRYKNKKETRYFWGRLSVVQHSLLNISSSQIIQIIIVFSGIWTQRQSKHAIKCESLFSFWAQHLLISGSLLSSAGGFLHGPILFEMDQVL